MRKVIAGTVVEAEALTPQQAASYVSESWRNAVEGIIETGRRLNEAKNRVGHGRWADAIELLPFSHATANKLMQIARHPDLSNSYHGTNLPASWRTLAVLAQLPPGEIPKRIDAREITPDLQRATAQEWVNIYSAAHQEAVNGYSQCVDGLTRALSYAKTYRPPTDLPETQCPIEELITRARDFLAIAEGWKDREPN